MKKKKPDILHLFVSQSQRCHFAPVARIKTRVASGITDLSVAVLAGLGGGHLDDLAGSAFQHHKAVFAQGRALHGVGGGRPGITCLEVQLCVCHACCGGENTQRMQTFIHIHN